MRLRSLSLACLLTLAAASAANAEDPCTAIPATSRLPSYLVEGRPFRGEVVHIVDGDGLCVSTGAGPNTWVEVRLENFFAPELNEGGRQAKAVLSRLTLGKAAVYQGEALLEEYEVRAAADAPRMTVRDAIGLLWQSLTGAA